MSIRDFSYTINSPLVWIVIMLLSLRAVYRCLFGADGRDYPHAGAFFIVFLGSLYMLLALYGLVGIPDYFEK